MAENGVAIGHEARQKGFQVPLGCRIGVLRDHKGSARVLAEALDALIPK
jgi:hypothetical protein